MLRCAIRLFGHLMLALTALAVGVMVEHSIASGQAGASSSGALPPNLAYIGLGAGAWLLSLFVVGIMDLIGHFPRGSRDPYEDHPKMSPSVQPAYFRHLEHRSERGTR